MLFHKLFKWHQTNPNRITGLVKQKSNHCQNCVFERKKLEFRNNTWPIQMHSVEVWIKNRKIVSLNTCPIESMFGTWNKQNHRQPPVLIRCKTYTRWFIQFRILCRPSVRMGFILIVASFNWLSSNVGEIFLSILWNKCAESYWPLAKVHQKRTLSPVNRLTFPLIFFCL